MQNEIKKFADMIKECNNIVFFGGAGVSTESGVKDYRSEDGLYSTVKEYGVSPERILSASFFKENPKVFYDFYKKYFLSDVKPNDAHKSLARLEQCGKLKAVITQNIDGLHYSAGSKNIIELHGTAHKYYCSKCGHDCADASGIILSGQIPKCDKCGGIVKPRVVLYEEMLDENNIIKAINYIKLADMLIIGGTSLAVSPANTFVEYFKGKYVVMINKTATEYDAKVDLIIRDKIGDVLKKTLEMLQI